MAKIPNAFLLTCLTNLHVGSEGVNYGVVDNLVQRDTITNNPIINSSSLKGALREFFKEKWGENDEKLNYIFGVDSSRDKTKKNEASIGHFKFFEAKLLSIPMRSDKKTFYSVTTKSLVDDINQQYAMLTGNHTTALLSNPFDDSNKAKEKVRLEDWETAADTGFTFDYNIGKDVATLKEEIFKKVVKQLPVIARNKLDNGTSKNLWYEEVVPRESRFVFFVVVDEKYEDDFTSAFKDTYIQIGGNASIGYGFTKITKI